MNLYSRLALIPFLLLQSGFCFAKGSVNLVLLPDPFQCHQLGIESALTKKSTLGIIGRSGCDSNRPTYGNANDEVRNKFSRILIPWRYSKKGVFTDSVFLQALVGFEKSQFSSQLGSTAEVRFLDLGFHVGYQWFWNNGFNVSVMGGAAYLIKISSTKEVVQNEGSDVVGFLDKNTETNIHGAAGVIVGWNF